MQRETGDGGVVVLTGTSGRIGRLTALAFAARGDRVVAGVRDHEALDTLRAEAAKLVGGITPLIVDCADPDGVAALAATAMREHGRIDTWITSAGLAMDADVVETEPDQLRRLLDDNVVGVLNGIRVAVPVLSGQGFGTLITIVSSESTTTPHHGATVVSEHAVKALIDSLRTELAHEVSPIRVVFVDPLRIRVPLAEGARSRLGRLRPNAAVADHDVVVDALLDAADHPGTTHGQWHPASFAGAWSGETRGLHGAVAGMLGAALLGTLALTVTRRR